MLVIARLTNPLKLSNCSYFLNIWSPMKSLVTEEIRQPMMKDDTEHVRQPMLRASTRNVFFPNLDGLRFLCFLSVFMCHIFTSNYNHINSSNVVIGLRRFFANGILGVNFFFVLSGFLITYILLTEQRTYGKVHVLQFWLRRALRIWPLYFACVLFGFLIFPMLRHMAGMPEDLNASPEYYIAFAGNIDVVKRQAWPVAHTLGVLWSVAIEEQFYFLWPILLVVINRKWLPLVFAGIIGGSIAFRAIYDSYFMHEHHTLSCMGDMAVGGLGAYLAQNKKVVERITDLAKWKIVVIYVVFAGIYFFREELLRSTHYSRVIERSVIAAIVLMIILEQNFARNSLFKLSRFKTISKLGTITYGMYCIHFLAIFIVTNLTIRYHLNSEVWEVLILEPIASLGLTIIISKFSYRFFESWFLRMKERFSFVTKVPEEQHTRSEQWIQKN